MGHGFPGMRHIGFMEISKMNVIDAKEIDSIEKQSNPRYSICTLLTNKQQYKNALISFREAGFVEPLCEYLYIDNTANNKYDAYSGVNKFLLQARGDYIILCHQDLILHADNISKLDKVINEISEIDKNWAVLGNAGSQAYHLTEYTGDKKRYARRGRFPAKTDSLDENFIVVKKSANISVSNDLHGFHMYGTDLCMISRILGYNSYVIDFHLWHLGGASIVAPVTSGKHATFTLDQAKMNFIHKYQRALSAHFIQTTCAILYISGSKVKNYIFNRKYVYSIQKRFNRWIIQS